MPTVLCLGVPANATVGIDLACWQVGPKFQGICQVPTGPHYIYTGGDGVHGMRTGQFVVLEPDGSDVWVGRWDPVTEQLVVLSDEDEYNRYADGVRRHDFDLGLGPYPFESFDDWRSLTNFISNDVLKKLSPVGNGVISGSQAPGAECNVETTRIYFTDLESFTPRRPMAPHELTRAYLDRSDQLEAIAGNDWDAILGELQYAFVLFVIGQSFEGFEQWKRLLSLVCTCPRAMTDHRPFYGNFINVLCSQMKQAPDDFFACDLTRHNFLTRCLSDLFELGEDTPLRPALHRLRALVSSKFGWHLTGAPVLNAQGTFNSDDEDAPAIVDLQE
ncbi:AAR2 splicing factor containing protein [Plasmodiophora brassicae]|uniref:AAR2 splicing factor homolog n=1 Tax=Plasmodiophora brassicae TaxID=37360 RepID=A0A0G4J6M0_PLABS|nr:hypothetical protein PBRA_002908 [Plasmodiophora brassicae]SPQ95044.1 unnamed protein product [Plasmodiophora brassicae]